MLPRAPVWDTSWTQCFKKQTEQRCCGSYRLSRYPERNDSQATQERSHLLFPGQSRSQRVLRRVCYPFIYFRIISEHWGSLKALWPGDWRPFWGDMEAITVQKTSKYYTTEFDLEGFLNGACISISNLLENIACHTDRPEARGPLKSGAWDGCPTCHPQTLPLTITYLEAKSPWHLDSLKILRYCCLCS